MVVTRNVSLSRDGVVACIRRVVGCERSMSFVNIVWTSIFPLELLRRSLVDQLHLPNPATQDGDGTHIAFIKLYIGINIASSITRVNLGAFEFLLDLRRNNQR